jgi:hypothetical protein
MFRKLLALIGIGLVSSCNSPKATGSFSPYSQSEANFIYNLLFCDDPSSFKPKDGEEPVSWQTVLFKDIYNQKAVLGIAEDTTYDGRTRFLAYNLLKQNGYRISDKILFGVIVEISKGDGLDVLAAFSDGGIRYINYTGKMAVVEGGLPDIIPLVKKLFEVSQNAVNKIGPWDKKRLPYPEKGNTRFTFLVSDGLYFGEGPSKYMQSDSMSGPIYIAATQILQHIVDASVK